MRIDRNVCPLLIAAIAVMFLASCGSGSDAVPPRTGGDIQQGTVPPGDPGLLARLLGDAEAGNTVAIPAGVYYETLTITKPLTVKPEDGATVIFDGECKRDNGVRIPTGSDITVSGIQVRNTVGAGVYIGNGDPADPLAENITIELMHINHFNCRDEEIPAYAGVSVWFAGCCMNITNNSIDYRDFSEPEHGFGNGIWFKSNEEVPSGGGHLISGNQITGGWDGIGGESEGDPHGTFDRDTIVEGNTITGCWDDGVQVEGGNTNVVVRDNSVKGCGTGIAAAPTLVGPLYIENNTIRDLVVGRYENQSCFKLGYDGAGTIFFTDNTCITQGEGFSQSNSGVNAIVTDGNCIVVTGYAIQIGDVLPDGSSLQGDTLSSAGDLIHFEGTTYETLAQFQDATGHETDGVESDACA